MLLLGLVDVPVWALLVTFLFVTLTIHYFWRFSVFSSLGIPGPRPWPIVGSAIPMIRKGPEYSAGLMKEYGKVHGIFFGTMPLLVIADEEMLADVHVKQFASFTNRRTFKTGDENMDALLTVLRDEQWKHVRNSMTPTFTTGKLRRMMTEINRCGAQLASSLGEEAEKGNEVSLKEFCGAFAMDVIASTAFGMRVDSQKDKNNVFVTKAKKAFSNSLTSPLAIIFLFLPFMRPILRKFRFSFVPKDVSDFFCDVTKQAMEIRNKDDDQSRTDFLQLMLNAQKGQNIVDDEDKAEGVQVDTKKGLTTPEILGNAFLFFVAGYETTATAVTHLLYHLALNQDCQEKLYQEIQNVMGDNETFDYNLVSKMTYLEQCVYESLRICPPATGSARECGKDITLKGTTIKKGMLVSIPVFSIHHDPEIWPDPEKFDPERFLPEKKAKMNPYHWLPFGYGPRNCIGMRMALLEVKVAVCHTLRHHRVVTCEKTQIPLKFKPMGILTAEKGVWVKFEKRVA